VREPYATLLEVGVVLVVAVLIWQGALAALRASLNTENPLVVVAIDMQPWYVTSMTPTLPAGDYLVIKGVRPEDVSVGDVIVFKRQYGDELIVHRVKEKLVVNGETRYRTQGDNVPSPDPYLVRHEDVVGVWIGVRIPLVGLLFLFAQMGVGRTMIIALMLVIIAYEALGGLRRRHAPSEEPRGGEAEPRAS